MISLPVAWGIGRRVAYEISHDFKDNHHIEDDVGHTYAGLQMIDLEGGLRGFVFADCSRGDRRWGDTISALYYLDDHSWEARYQTDVG
jgi:hypothetical protein